MKAKRLLALSVMFIPVSVWAQSTAPAPSASATPAKSDPFAVPADVQEWVDKAKNPFKGVTWGADQRIRQEYTLNANSFNQHSSGHESNYGRYRTRLWGSVAPTDEIEFNGRLAWEWREYYAPRTQPNTVWNSMFVDHANVKLKSKEYNSYLTVGRQDIALGNGWLVYEGTPRDGSTSYYFDAARYNINVKEIQSTLDVIGIYQTAMPDSWLRTAGTDDIPLSEQNETGAILYGTNKSITDTQLDGFFIYKHDERVLSSGLDADIYTFGGRAERLFTKNLKARLEGCYQFGNRNSTSINAWGVNSRSTYLTKDRFDSQFYLDVEALSGDNPNTTDTYEGFDPLWGRYTQWSEMYIPYSSFPLEGRSSEMTNLFRLSPGFTVVPIKNMLFSTSYNALWSLENPNANKKISNMNFGDGNFRGHLFQAFVKYKFNRFMSGHLWAEYMLPGTYYRSPSEDNALFLRAELMLTF